MKTPFKYHDQLELLQSRGLYVEDTERATFYLKNIGYYRLSGYLKNFQKRDSNEFFSETTFEKVLKLYVFDRKLRLLFLDAIERIEVSFRAIVSDTLCFETGDAHWFLRKENYFFYEKENWSHNDQFEKIKKLTPDEKQDLQKKGLVEGRSPNFHISSKVAQKTGERGEYMSMKGIEDEYAEKMITDFLKKFHSDQRQDLEAMLLDKLPNILDEEQKKNKVKNLLQKMRKNRKIKLLERKNWVLSQ